MSTDSAPAFQFSLPAFVEDFPDDPKKQAELQAHWKTSLSAFLRQAVPSFPSAFYNPADPAPGLQIAGPAQIVEWFAFPNRLLQYYSTDPPVKVTPSSPYKLTQEEIFRLADTGFQDAAQKTSFQPIPTTLCPNADWAGTLKTFGPYGPRGWLDEYCEWSVAHDANGKIVRIDFVCENPEYWNSLWKVDPEKVRSIYESTLNFDVPAERRIAVTQDELTLFQDGKPVTDPDTGRAAYNPLNKWNRGPVQQRFGGDKSGGAMHLTSTPNTLQTELGLAGLATVKWTPDRPFPQNLICCGQFGQEYRNSDPHIGYSVWQLLNGQLLFCLANPFGLYIQQPTDFDTAWALGPRIMPGKNGIPANAKGSDIWHNVRGLVTHPDPSNGGQAYSGNLLMHIVCQIPSEWLKADPSLTLEDILLQGEPIRWAGQISSRFKIGLYARPVAGTPQQGQVACNTSSSADATPQQCMHAKLWNGYYAGVEEAPTGMKMSLASNTTFIPAQLPSSGDGTLTVTCTPVSSDAVAPSDFTVAFLTLGNPQAPDKAIATSVTEVKPNLNYAVPGNTYPSPCIAVTFAVKTSGAAPGLRDLQVTYKNNPPQVLPAAINVSG